MHLFELSDGDLGVNLGGVELGMAEELLDVADVGPVLQHQRGAGMAEQMAGAGFADLGRVDMAAHQLRHAVRCEGFAKAG